MLVHAIFPASRANGPGLRAVVFLQGCSLGCNGCFNRATHSFQGAEMEPERVAQAVIDAQKARGLEGVTFSGGEPMQQADSLLALTRLLLESMPTLSLGMFSGYSERELDRGRYSIWRSALDAGGKQALWQAIRSNLDFAVLGRFNVLEPSSAPLRSSRNQVLRFFGSRYSEADFSEQTVEVTIGVSGQAVATGFPALGLPW